MPTFPVRFVGDVGNLGQFAGQIEQSIIGAERSIEAAFARLGSARTGIKSTPAPSVGAYRSPSIVGDTFFRTSNVEFDRMNNRITAQVQAVQRMISGYNTQLVPTATGSEYQAVPNFSDNVIKELTLTSRAFNSFTRDLEGSNRIQNILMGQQKAFRETEASLKNLGAAYAVAGTKAAAQLRADPKSGVISVGKSQIPTLSVPAEITSVATGADSINLIKKLERMQRYYNQFGVPFDAAPIIARLQSFGVADSVGWSVKETTRGDSKSVIGRVARLTPAAVTQATQGFNDAINNEIIPQINKALTEAESKILSSPVVQRLSNASQAAIIRGASIGLGDEEAAFLTRYPQVVKRLQQQGLGLGAKAGSDTFMRNAYLQGFKVNEVYKDFEKNLIHLSGTMRDSTGIAGQWSYALDRNGNVINRWGNRLNGARGILSQTGRDFLKVIEWTVATSVVFGTLGMAVRSVSQINTLNEDLQRFSITAKLTGAETNQMFKNLAEVAYQTATPITELVKAADDIALATRRANQSSAQWRQEIIDLSKAVGILTNISGLDTVQATDLLTASMKQLGLTAAGTLDILNKATAAAGGQANAITDIFQALGTVTEAAEAANLNINEQIAAVQVIAQVTGKTAADVATAFKNLFGALGSTGAEKKLSEFGIAVRDAEGNIKPFLQVYKEISDALKTGVIPEGRLNEVIRAISGGPRRAPDAAALLSNITKVFEVSEISASATNEALIANAKILDTNNAKLRQLQVAVDTKVFEKLNETIKSLTSALLTLGQGFAEVFSAVPTGVIQFAIQLGIILTTATLLNKVFTSIGNSFFISGFKQGFKGLLGGGIGSAATLTRVLPEIAMLNSAGAIASKVKPGIPGPYIPPVKYVSGQKSGEVIGRSSEGAVTRLSLRDDSGRFIASRPSIAPIQNATVAYTASVKQISKVNERLSNDLNSLQKNLSETTKRTNLSYMLAGRYQGYQTDLNTISTLQTDIAARNLSYTAASAQISAIRKELPLIIAQSSGSLPYETKYTVPTGAASGLAATDEAAKNRFSQAAVAAYRKDVIERGIRDAMPKLKGVNVPELILAAPQVQGDIDKAAKPFVDKVVTSLQSAFKARFGKAAIGGAVGAGITGAGLAASGGDQGVASLLQNIGISGAVLGLSTGNLPVAAGGAAMAALATAYQALTASQEENKRKVIELRQASYSALQQYRIDEAGVNAIAKDMREVQSSLRNATVGSEAYVSLQKQYGQLIIENVLATNQLNASFKSLGQNLRELSDTAKKSGQKMSEDFETAVSILGTGASGASFKYLSKDVQKTLIAGLSEGLLEAAGQAVPSMMELAPIKGSLSRGLKTGSTVYDLEYAGTYNVGQGGNNVVKQQVDLMRLTSEQLKTIARLGPETAGIPATNQNYALLQAAALKFKEELGPTFQIFIDKLGEWVDKFGIGAAQLSNLILKVGVNAESARSLGLISTEEYANIQARTGAASTISNIISGLAPPRNRGEAAKREKNLDLIKNIESSLMVDTSSPYGLATSLISEDQAVEWFTVIAKMAPEKFGDVLSQSKDAIKAAAIRMFAGVVEASDEASTSVAQKWETQANIFGGIQSAAESLDQQLLSLEARKMGGEFKDNSSGYTALKDQFLSTKEALSSLDTLIKTESTETLKGLAEFLDTNVVGFSALTTAVMDQSSGMVAVTENWDQFGNILAAVASTMGLTGNQIDLFMKKAELAARIIDALRNATLASAAAFGYQAGTAAVSAWNLARLGEAQGDPSKLRSIVDKPNAGASAYLKKLLDDLKKEMNSIIFSGKGSTFADKVTPTKGTKGPGLDIGELDLPEEIWKSSNRDAIIKDAVAKATALQKTIPGAAAEAKNDVVSILHGTQKLMEVRGVREDLLRRSLDELADIERKRLEFETKATTLQRIRVGAGSFAAIANVPINAQTGVSVGSPQGPITVNLNINGQVLTPAQMNQLADKIGAAIKSQIANG